MPDAFYVADGDSFVSTQWTRGPWDERAQHAGPPAALVGRAFEKQEPFGLQVARFTMEILRPIPIARLTIDVDPLRTGKRVQYLTASLKADDEEVARASAWRIRTSDVPMPATDGEAPPFDGPDRIEGVDSYDVGGDQSYFLAMEWRYARGSIAIRGPSSVWMRMRKPLVEGEPIMPLSRILAAADSGNGISAILDFRTHLFINTELTVHLARMPEGEWVCIDAETRQDANGIGVAQSVIWDERHRLGTGAQSLLIAPR